MKINRLSTYKCRNCKKTYEITHIISDKGEAEGQMLTAPHYCVESEPAGVKTTGVADLLAFRDEELPDGD